MKLNLEIAEYEEARDFTERDNTSMALIDREAGVLIEITVPGFMNNDDTLDAVIEHVRESFKSRRRTMDGTVREIEK